MRIQEVGKHQSIQKLKDLVRNYAPYATSEK